MIYWYRDLDRGELMSLVRRGEIVLGGDERFKIYGRLDCKQGKRAKRKYKLFFSSEEEAIAHGFRPCGSCLNKKYKIWKAIKQGETA